MSETARKPRPGGRTERNRLAVASAVLRLIQEGNLDFEIQEVAALSDVHRTTIFRRWPDRGALLAEAMAEHSSRISIEPTDDLATDVRRLILAIRDFFADPVEMALNRMMAITDNELFHRQMRENWDPILEHFEQIFIAARKRGELSAETDIPMIVTSLVSVLLVEAVFTRAPVRDAFVERLIDQTLAQCRAPSPAMAR